MNQSPAAGALDEALERFRASVARARVERWRGTPEDERTPVAYPWPGAEEALATLEAPPELRAAAAAHLARARAEAEAAAGRERLRQAAQQTLRAGGREAPAGPALLALFGGDAAFAPALAEAAEPLAGAIRGVRRDADEAAMRSLEASAAGRHPDAGPELAPRREAAQAFLAATADAGALAAERLGLARGDLAALAARLPRPDPRVPPRERYRRLASRGPMALFAARLGARLRLEAPHRAPTPRPRLAVLAAGKDLRLAPGPAELGMASELLAAEALGRGLGLALVDEALPPALRRPVAGTAARAFGTLAAWVAGAPAALRRMGLARGDAEELGREAAGWLLVRARFDAASLLARGADLGGDAASERLAEACFVALEPGPASLLLSTGSAGGARFRSTAGAFALAWVLREHHDEDWWRNPRATGDLETGLRPGGLGSVEAWLEGLGGDASLAANAAVERLSW